MATSAYSLVDISGRFVLNQTTAGTQSGSAVAATGNGGFAILYADSGFTSSVNGSYTTSVGGLRLRPFSGGGAALGDEIIVSSDYEPRYTSTGLTRLANGSLVVTWTPGDQYMQVQQRLYSATLQPLTAVTAATQPGGAAVKAATAALADGGYVIAYEVQKSSTDHDVYAQRYDSSGVAVGGAVAVETSTAYATDIAVTGLTDGGYAIGYTNRTDPQSRQNSSVARAVVNADGSLRLAPTVTDAATSASPVNDRPELTALATGEFLFTYTDNTQITTLTVAADGLVERTATIASGSVPLTGPSAAVSSTGFTLVSYDPPQPGTSIFPVALLPPGATSPAATAQSVAYGGFSGPIAWLDESHAIQINETISTSDLVNEGGDGSGWGITADLWQVERNTTGAATSETLWLDGLADRVTMGGGDDGVFAGDGNNSVNLGAGNDVAVGGSGPDALIGGAGVDWLYGMAGADYLYGGTETDALTGGDGNDFLFGEDGDDYAFGDAGDDAISGAAGVDRLYGGTGSDTIDGGADTDALYGEDGSDRLFGGAGDDYLFGGADGDILFGGTGNDVMWGDTGNDTLVGDTGSDWLIGGAGADLFQFQGLDSGIDTIVNFQPGFDSVLLIGTARTSAADALAGLAQVGANTVLMTSATSGLIFLNNQVSQFTGASFAVA